ncbi:hypothetical protein BDV33DRAFT_166171 [Aspergillus novoparasiticus]|uniref:Uncharacterized protein n=1 Tax=Aspergillus novoparasiticus TaxID=986946 RepID=A0A5N6F2I8_9EURO|nr:hypothetical protein BDV33DRAFT_166171 [Aspergillus novoparasiticus]
MGKGPQLSKWLQRPETDYERWLRKQDEHFKPGDRPLYGPDMEGTNDVDEIGANKDGDKSLSNSHKAPTAYGHFTGQQSMPTLSSTSLLPRLNNYAVIGSLLVSIVLTFAILKAFRKRRRRGGVILVSENPGNRRTRRDTPNSDCRDCLFND